MAETNYNDILCQAIDTIVQQRISNLSFDQTIICTIVDDTDAKNGHYVVTDKSVRFDAYSENTEYVTDDDVYVTIPKGDYNQTKVILSKYTADNNLDPLVYIKPLDQMFIITDNLVKKGEPNVISAGILANGRKVSTTGRTTTPGRTKIIWEYLLSESDNTDIKNNAIFDTLGIKAGFKCDLLSTYNVREGHYGLAITLYSDMNPESGMESVVENTILFDSEEMFGNPYSFVTFFEQQKIIDIGKLNNITKISIALYQDGNFQYTESLEAKDMKMLPSTYVNSEGVTEDLMDNIFVSDVEIYFGMNIANVSDNTFSIYCSNSSTFSTIKEQDDENYNVKTIFPIWFNKNPDNNKYIGYSDGIYRTYVDADDPQRIIGAQYLEDNYRAKKDYYDKGANLNQLELEEQGIPPVQQILQIYAYAQDVSKMMTKLYNLVNGNLKNICDKLQRDVSSYQTNEQKANTNIAYQNLFNSSGAYALYLDALNKALNEEDNVYGFVPTVTSILKEYGQVYLDLAQWTDLSAPYGNDSYMSRIYSKYSPISSMSNLRAAITTYFLAIRENIPDSIAAIYDAWNKMQSTILEDCLELIESIEDLIGSYTEQGNNPSISYEFNDLNTLFQQGGVQSYSESKEIFEEKYKNRYCIYWYRYVENYYDANERYMPSGWKRLLGYENIGLPKDWESGDDGNDYWVARSNERISVKIGDPAVETEQIQAILIYNHEVFKSNILTFKNEEEVIDENTKSAVTGLWIAMTDQTDDHADTYCSKETYQLYGMTNMLINSAERYQRRKLRARFTGLEQDDNYLKQNCVIYWYIPIHSTMLDCNRDELIEAGFSFYDPAVDVLPSAPYGNNYIEGYIMLYRQIASDTDEHFLASTEMFYQIKNYFMPTATNNTIRCRVVKSRQYVYDAEQFFTFASYGSNGTDYTLCIFPSTNQAAVKQDQPLPLSIGVYDYNNDYVENESQNIQLNIINGFSYNASNVKTNSSAYFYTTGRDTEAFIGQAYKPGYGILKGTATITIDKFSDAEDSARDTSITNSLDNPDPDTLKYNQRSRTVTLESYFAIPWASDDYYIEGPSFVIYNSMGQSPQYYSDPIRLFSMKTNREIEDVVWKTEYFSNHALSSGADDFSNKITTFVSNYLPKIKEIVTEVDSTTRREYRLSVPNMYVSDNDYYCSLVAFKNNQRLWVQPIYMLQNRFDSPMLNAWDGELTIDEKNGTIMSAMVGSGKKNSDNTFSGVLMGEVGEKTQLGSTTGEGLFGFDHGEQSFGFKTDGTAFIGKAKRGRIEFNGNSGTIASASYTQERDAEKRTGMKIDLDDGQIDMLGAYIADAVDQADSREENILNAQFTHNNEQDGYNNEVKYNPTGSRVTISTKSPFLKIQSPSVWYTNEKRVVVDDFGNKSLEVDPNTTQRKAYDDFWNSIDYYKSDAAILNLLNNYWDINDNVYPRTNNEIRTVADIEDMDTGVYAPILRTITSTALLNGGYTNANVDDLDMFVQQKAAQSQGFIGIALDGEDPAMQKGDYLYRYTAQDEQGANHWKYIPSSEVTEAMINSSGTVCLARYDGHKITNLNNQCGQRIVNASGWSKPGTSGTNLTFNNINDTITLVEAIRNSGEEEDEYLIKLKFLKDEDFLRFRAIANIGDDVVSITGFVPPDDADAVMYTQADGPLESVSYEFGVKDSTTLLEVGTSKYYMQSEGFTEGHDQYKRDAKGLKFDLAAQKFTAYGGFKLFAQDAKTLNNIEIGSTGTFLHVKYNVNPIEGDPPEYVSLMKITTNEFLLQSKNWDKEQKTGTQFNVGQGTLTSYNFSLEAVDGRDTSKNYGSFIRLSSRGNPFFQIHYQEHAKAFSELQPNEEDEIVYDTDLMYVSTNKLVLQSKDWIAPRLIEDLPQNEQSNYNPSIAYSRAKGLQFDISNGKLTAYNKFRLVAYDSDDSNTNSNTAGSYVELSSQGTVSSPYLKVYYQHNAQGEDSWGQTLLNIDKNNFYMRSQDWSYNAQDLSQGSGMQIDMSRANIIAYNFHLYAFNNSERYAGSYVKISSDGTNTNPFFQVHFKDVGDGTDQNFVTKNIDLIKITQNTFLIQSQNYKQSNNIAECAGVRLDLDSGKFTGYNFGFTAYDNGSQNNGRYMGSNVIINSNGSPYLRVHYTDYGANNNPTTTPGLTPLRDIDVLNISRTSFVIQSPNWNYSNKTGLKFDITNATLQGFNFEFSASRAGNPAGTVTISSEDNTYPIKVINSDSNQRFRVKWDGSLEANAATVSGAITATSGTFTNVTISSGSIAGWRIQNNRIDANNGTIYLDSSTGVISGASINGGNMSISGSGEGSGSFGVTDNGVLSATGANVTGTINANQGTFNNVDIQSGTIAGWNINSTTLSKGDVVLNSATGTISGATISGGSLNIANGKLTANDTNGVGIQGTLSADKFILTQGTARYTWDQAEADAITIKQYSLSWESATGALGGGTATTYYGSCSVTLPNIPGRWLPVYSSAQAAANGEAPMGYAQQTEQQIAAAPIGGSCAVTLTIPTNGTYRSYTLNHSDFEVFLAGLIVCMDNTAGGNLVRQIQSRVVS